VPTHDDHVVVEATDNATAVADVLAPHVGRVVIANPTLRKWVLQAERAAGQRPGSTTEERDRIITLEREARQLRQANEILRKASAYLAMVEARPPIEAMIAFINDHRELYEASRSAGCCESRRRPTVPVSRNEPIRRRLRLVPGRTWCSWSRSGRCMPRTSKSVAPARSGGSSATKASPWLAARRSV
jgi:transposase-like protein